MVKGMRGFAMEHTTITSIVEYLSLVEEMILPKYTCTSTGVGMVLTMVIF